VAGKTDAASDQLIRDNLRNAMVGAINDAPAADRASLLQRFLDVQPSNGDRGALFTQFRSANLPPGLGVEDLGLNSTTLAGSGARADGVVRITDAWPLSRGPARAGVYLAEDKAGPSAFRLDQAQRYSDALARDNGHITAANGQQYDGVIYFFSTRADAQLANAQLIRLKLDPHIHVAYYDPAGALQWLRR
jgi:hypothetical protein